MSDIYDGGDMSLMLPDRKGDSSYREGIFRFDKEVADYVFICAPEITAQTRPHFIEKLKETGVTIDFDLDFSLGYAKQLEFKKQVEHFDLQYAQGGGF